MYSLNLMHLLINFLNNNFIDTNFMTQGQCLIVVVQILATNLPVQQNVIVKKKSPQIVCQGRTQRAQNANGVGQ